MKKSTFRLLLILLSIFPPLFYVIGFGAVGLFSSIKNKDLMSFMLSIPFITSTIIYFLFVKDTVSLIKDGK